MTIIDALKETTGTRVTCGNRWLVWNDTDGWLVYEHKPYSRVTTEVIETQNESDAVEKLTED
jgi:hypothetical protein